MVPKLPVFQNQENGLFLGTRGSRSRGPVRCGLAGLLMGACLLGSCENPGTVVWKTIPVTLTPRQAVSATSANSYSNLAGVSMDSAGNLYVSGALGSGAVYDFGAGAFATLSNGNSNSVLVKYNSSGTALWSQTTTNEQFDNLFLGMATDSAGNSYVAGYARTNGSLLQYGNAVSFVPSSSSPWELVMVKFDASGAAQWISAPTSSNTSVGYGAAVDGSGNSYLAGIIEWNGAYTIGSSAGGSVTAIGTNSSDYSNNNGVLIKYDPSGIPVWAQTPPSGGLATCYQGITTDPSGNIVVSGWFSGTGGLQQDFGNGQVATGGWQGATPQNALVVKYDTNGLTQWVRTTGPGAPGISFFTSVCSDAAGNLYAAGAITGPGTYDFGNGQAVTASISGLNGVVVKYSPAGTTLWARTVGSGSVVTQFNGVACDSSGNVAAAGTITNAGTADFGLGRVVTSLNIGSNALLVRYDSSGKTTSASTVPSNSDSSEYKSVFMDSQGNVYAVGDFSGSSPLSLSGTVSVPIAFPGNQNALIVKYH